MAVSIETESVTKSESVRGHKRVRGVAKQVKAVAIYNIVMEHYNV